MIKKIVTNFTSLFTGEVIARACHFFAVIYIARIFGAAGFGAISFSLAIISYFIMLSNPGLGEFGVREISRSRDIKDIAETILSIRLAAASVLFVAVLVIAFLFKKTPTITYLMIFFGVTLFPYALSLEWVFRGVQEMRYNAYSRIINAFIYLGAVLLFVKDIQDILKVALITVLADLTSCAFYYINYRRKFGGIGLHVDLRRWGELLRLSLPIFASSAMIIFYFNFGTIALGIFKDEQSVGFYSAAAKIAFFIYAVSDLFVASVFPVMSKLYHESREKFAQFMRYCLKISMVLGIPVGIGGTVLGPKIIEIVYGPSYAQSGPLFQMMSWFAAINLAGFALSYSLVSCDRQDLYLKVVLYGCLFNIAFNLVGVPLMGYYAPSAALVLTEGIICVCSFFIVGKIARLPFLELSVRPFISAVVMGAILLALFKLNVFILLVIAAVSYFGVLFAIGGITRDELLRVKEAFAQA
ncbi:MAG: flippase [Candidatus Omnitrophica bacterium]|nr:flippase [Candidatus Omnitrophota bacterium]